MSEETQALGEVRVSVDKLSGKIDHLDNSVRWSRIREVALIAVMVLVVAALVMGAWALVSVRSEQRCVASLAAASADRVGVLAPLSAELNNARDGRQDAETNLILTVIPRAGQSQAQQRLAFTQALQAVSTAAATYDKANDAYQQAYSAHPPPVAPAYSC